MTLADSANAYLRARPGLAAVARRTTRPARHLGMPVLRGPARGLRVSVGDSTMMRLLTRVEPDVEDALLAHLAPGDAMWDVGANIGWFSLLAARAVGPSGEVTAFEPALRNAAQITLNAARNGVSVTVVGAAVSDRSGWGRFDDLSSLTGRLSAAGGAIVPMVTLDEWASGHGAPAVVKIDVEGAELDVLRGAGTVLAAARPVILCECHGTQTGVDRALRAVGYDVSAVEMPGASIAVTPGWIHLLGIPR